MKNRFIFSILSILLLGRFVHGEESLTKDEIVASVKSEDQSGLLELKWGITETIVNNEELFVTVHGAEPRFTGSESSVSIFFNIKGKYKRLKKLTGETSFFEKPNFFWAEVEGQKAKQQLLQITEVWPGTGHFIKEHIFLISLGTNPLDLMVPVRFVPAPDSYKEKLKPGEGVWKGGTNSFDDNGLFFTFYIWNERDGNCCPTGGKVVGQYSLKKLGNEFEISARDFKRSPVE